MENVFHTHDNLCVYCWQSTHKLYCTLKCNIYTKGCFLIFFMYLVIFPLSNSCGFLFRWHPTNPASLLLGPCRQNAQYVVLYGNCRWSRSTKNPQLRHTWGIFFLTKQKKNLVCTKIREFSKKMKPPELLFVGWVLQIKAQDGMETQHHPQTIHREEGQAYTICVLCLVCVCTKRRSLNVLSVQYVISILSNHVTNH